ncbi:hypothetical protein [Deinococcus multiflagellatus]|uniref:Serine protease n=1 Tax=Deinococcus multiflagellatus TaxID=1656887 RepID=A0ABW1ZT13_9DEIO
MPLLITNKHVVHGAQRLELRFHLSEARKPIGLTHTVIAEPFSWVDHPDPNVDLCAILLWPYIQAVHAQGLTAYYVGVRRGNLPSAADIADLTAVESVTMVGYPIGLADNVNNFPIVRRGITANHPAVDFNGTPEGVVDMACFPGSSGSPIFVLNDGVYQNKNGGTVVGNRFFLLGVLYGGPVMKADGQIEVRTIPTAQVPVAVTQMMIHLGYYVKAREVLALVEHVRNSLGPPPPLPPQP